ncbi:hypothetical protein GCM10020254_54950 [Streptomyces goshikiensis]
MYVEMRGVGSKRQTLSLTSSGFGVGEFEITFQPSRGRHGELERRLQVGLLEAGEDPPRVRHLELGVQVGLLVDRVDEAVQALTAVGVRAVRDDPELVGPGREVVQRDPGVPEDGGHVQGRAVQDDLVDGRRDQVDEGPGTRLGRLEAHGGDRGERSALLRRAEIEFDLVRVDGEQLRPLLSLFTGEIRARHAVISFDGDVAPPSFHAGPATAPG